MSKKELRDQNAWLAKHVMGFTPEQVASIESHGCYFVKGEACGKWFDPHTDPAAAMAVLEKCAEKEEVLVFFNGHEWSVCAHRANQHDSCDYEYGSASKTLPLAIAKFARSLFSK